MSKDSKASPAGDDSAKAPRQEQSLETPPDPLQINYPQKMLDEEDFVGIKGIKEAARRRQRRSSMTDREKLVALRAILLSARTETIDGDEVQILDRASHSIARVIAEIVRGQRTFDRAPVKTLLTIREKLAEAESLLLPD